MATVATDNFTRVDEEYFENPVERIGVSGGTAPFFVLKLTEKGIEHFGASNDDGMISASYFIGKDLSRAVDELEFYERAITVSKSNESDDTVNDGGLGKLLDCTFEYAGIVTLQEMVKGSAVDRELLVLKNLYDSKSKLRLLDFKIGEKTAAANWRGKSRFRAFKQGFVDGMTNSTREGFRLEGFDGQPQVITSMDPLLDLKINKSGKSLDGTGKKAMRLALQKMSGSVVLMYYLDLHEVTCDAQSKKVSGETRPVETAHVYSESEVAEIVLLETVCKLVKLMSTCKNVTASQKWIGSSIALGYDAGFCNQRSDENEEKLRSGVIVNIFDWGRSELLLKDAYNKLSIDERADRDQYWGYYVNGVNHLSFDAADRYYDQFSNSKGWDEITVRVLDYDSNSADDFIGEVTIPLLNETTSYSEEFVLRNKGKALLRDGTAGGKRGSLKLDISWWEAPETSSNLRGSWRVTVDRASNLKAMDITASDPYCLIIAKSKSFEFEQMSSVKIHTLNPVWEETFEIPVVSSSSKLLDSLEAAGLDVNSKKLKQLFGTESKANLREEWAKLFK